MTNSTVVPDNRRNVPGKRYWARQVNLDYRCTLSGQIVPIGATIDEHEANNSDSMPKGDQISVQDSSNHKVIILDAF